MNKELLDVITDSVAEHYLPKILDLPATLSQEETREAIKQVLGQIFIEGMMYQNNETISRLDNLKVDTNAKQTK